MITISGFDTVEWRVRCCCFSVWCLAWCSDARRRRAVQREETGRFLSVFLPTARNIPRILYRKEMEEFFLCYLLKYIYCCFFHHSISVGVNLDHKCLRSINQFKSVCVCVCEGVCVSTVEGKYTRGHNIPKVRLCSPFGDTYTHEIGRAHV